MDMHWSEEELRKMEEADLRDAVLEELTDIDGIEIDRRKPVPARAEEYVRKTGNPFLVRVGDYAVKIGYSDQGGTLNDRMKRYIEKIAEVKY